MWSVFTDPVTYLQILIRSKFLWSCCYKIYVRISYFFIRIVAIIPGPSEPHLTMNSYLSLLLCDLLDFWNGDLNSSFVIEVQQFLSVPYLEWHVTYQQPAKHVDS